LASFEKEDLWWEDTHLVLQSDDELIPNKDVTQDTVAENVQFVGEEKQISTVVLDSDPRDTVDVQTNKFELKDFLSRPVKIDSFSVSTSSNTNYRYNIWHSFLNNANIKRKLENFYLLRGNLHIKVVVNATPFLYGTYLASYLPLQNSNTLLDVSQVGTSYINNNDARAAIYCQRQHFWIEFHKNQGGEMVVPFLYPKNYVNLTSASDVQGLGVFEIQALLAPRVATTNASSSCYVTVYAWLENVELEGQTKSLSLQSDEFATGTISRPASIIAGIGRRLSDVPVIGPFAKATNFAAGAVAKVASLFGFTNVPSIDDSVAFKNTPYFAFASAHISTPVDRLTIDPKNELTIDPTVTGSISEDSLSIRNLVTRETLMYGLDWAPSDLADAYLFRANVNPMNLRGGTTTTTSTGWIIESPAALVGSHFTHWRGDMQYRLKVVCSKYHQGRILISWDPSGSDTTSADSAVVQSIIMDISQSDEITFKIPYMQPTAWQELDMGGGEQIQGGGASPTYTSKYSNGRLSISILNPLTAPLSTANARLYLFVAGCDNLEFANPSPPTDIYSPLLPQSEEYVLGETTPEPVHRYDINFGEDIRSMRVLMRRTHLYRRESVTVSGAATTDNTLSLNRFLYPAHYGYTSNNPVDTGKNRAGTSSVGCNLVVQGPIQRLMACHVGIRGSMNYHFNLHGTSKPAHFSVERRVSDFGSFKSTDLRLTNNLESFVTNNTNYWGNAGMSLTNTANQPSLQVNIPMMSQLRFLDARGLFVGSNEPTKVNNYQVTLSDYGNFDNILETYCNIGPDFNLVHFVSTVPVYKYAIGQ